MGTNTIVHGKDVYDVLQNDTGKAATTPIKVMAGGMKSNSDFVPSSYTGKITTTATGVSTAIASGASKLLLQSLEVTGLEEFAVLAFGTSSANAIANLTIAAAVGTTGIIIPSGDSTAGGLATPITIGIPANATHFALVDGVSGLVQVIMVTQGV
jgi:hypothetical protein